MKKQVSIISKHFKCIDFFSFSQLDTTKKVKFCTICGRICIKLLLRAACWAVNTRISSADHLTKNINFGGSCSQPLTGQGSNFVSKSRPLVYVYTQLDSETANLTKSF